MAISSHIRIKVMYKSGEGVFFIFPKANNSFGLMKENLLNPFQSIFEKLESIEREVLNNRLQPIKQPQNVELVDRKELAKRLLMTERNIINLENKGEIKRIKIGKCVRYNWEKIKSRYHI